MKSNMKTSVEKAKDWGFVPTDDYIRSGTVNSVIAALDEYSMEMSIEFANWISKETWFPSFKGRGKWDHAITGNTVSTKDLYSLFLSKHL